MTLLPLMRRARWREPVQRWRRRITSVPARAAHERREPQKLELVFASITDGLVIIEANGIVTKLNAAAKNIYRQVIPIDIDAGITQAGLAELFVRWRRRPHYRHHVHQRGGVPPAVRLLPAPQARG